MTAVVEDANTPPAWPIYLHALAFGIGWAPALLAFLLSPAVENAVFDLPTFLLGPLLLGAALLLFPPAWPVLMAMAWRELDLAERLERTYARKNLARMYRSYAFVFAAIGGLALIAAGASLGRWGAAVNTAWVGPGIMAGLHLGLARWVQP